jgi:hypothetical protein
LRPVDGAPTESDIELQIAPPTRLDTYSHGGEVRFEIDRQVAEQFYASHTGGPEAFRAVSRAVHAFVERAVRHLTDDVGIRQFLVMGSSISGRANVHEIVRTTAPEARTVYVLFDPLMLVYAHRLLQGADGTTAYVRARLRDVDVILDQAAITLDLSRPVAVVMPTNLSYVRWPPAATWWPPTTPATCSSTRWRRSTDASRSWPPSGRPGRSRRAAATRWRRSSPGSSCSNPAWCRSRSGAPSRVRAAR